MNWMRSVNFENKFHMFSFKSLIAIPDVFSAISKVKTKCNKVAVMSLFQVGITKSIWLEEFEQRQSQATSQVQLLLKDSWLTTLRTSVKGSFRDIGKVWFNLIESNWEVYKMIQVIKVDGPHSIHYAGLPLIFGAIFVKRICSYGATSL